MVCCVAKFQDFFIDLIFKESEKLKETVSEIKEDVKSKVSTSDHVLLKGARDLGVRLSSCSDNLISRKMQV